MAKQTNLAAAWHEKGFHVQEGVFSKDEVKRILDEGNEVCRKHITDLKPGEDPATATENVLAIHFPHKLSPLILATMRQPGIVDVLTSVISPNVKCMQSMLFFKHAGKPGQAWHQDEMFIPTRDRSLTGAWIALDDATVDNGCLWVLPGSHRPGVLWPSRKHNDPEYDPTVMSYDFPYRDEDSIPVEVPAGAVVFFNGYLLHKSLRNRRTKGYRRSLVHHYMSAESLLPWDCGGKIPPTKDNRDIVLVAGADPYAYKGTEDLTRPYVRRDTTA